MKLQDKVNIYHNIAKTCKHMSFGDKNMVLLLLAKGLNLDHWVNNGNFELHHKYFNSKPLLVLNQITLDNITPML